MDYTVHGVAKSRHDWATFTSQALPGKNTGVGNHFLLQGIFLTQGSNPGLLLGRQILYYCATWEALLMVSVYSQLGPTICYPMDCSTPASLSITNSQSFSNSCPSCRWCHSTTSSSVVPLSSRLQSFPASGPFQMSPLFVSRWPKYWGFNFSISLFNEYSGLTSFRMDWLNLLAVQGMLKTFLQHHSSKTSSLQPLSFLYSSTLTSMRDYWKNHSFE